jgi:alpha-beta hydrolase superfamily lysophospholipase
MEDRDMKDHPTGARSSMLVGPVAALLSGACAGAPAAGPTDWAGDPDAERYARWWPESAHLARRAVPNEEWHRFRDHLIHLDRLPGDGTSPITVMLLHGGGGHGRLVLPFGLPIWAAGHEVVAPDLPNYGRSIPGRERVTFDLWVELVSALVDKERERGRVVVLYGFSIGGLTAYHVAAENPGVAGVIATMLADMRERDVRDAAAANRFLSRVVAPVGAALPWLFDGVRLRARTVAKVSAMAPDPELVRSLAEDPRIGAVRMPASFFRTLSARRPAKEPEDFVNPPVLLVHPERDEWTPLPLSERFFERIRAPKRQVVLEGAAHAPLQQPGFDQLQEAVLDLLASIARAQEPGGPGE